MESSNAAGRFGNFCALSLFALLTLFACHPDETASITNKEQERYREPHRNQFHFSPDSMWMNDPNGMVYYDGEYHLFYQYYPDSTVWGPMHWGHAVSTDLVHWEHLPIALSPDSLGYIFSGSAVIDWNNSSGLGDGETPPMIAIFTHHDPVGAAAGRHDFQYQSIAYSLDKGRSWAKYAGNPVIPNPGIHDFRDPKVIWDEAHGQWLMVFAAYDHLKLYSSRNLLDWIYLSDFGREYGVHAGVWECPDLFPMQLKGTGETYWVLLLSINPGGPNGGSATQYFVGDFDGRTIEVASDFIAAVTPDRVRLDSSVNVNERAVWLDYGRDNYAGVTWSDVPKSDGRRLFLGWMSNWDYAQETPTDRWRSSMTIPRTLEMVATENGPRLRQQPVKELEQLETKILFSEALKAGIPYQHDSLNQSKWQITISEDQLSANSIAGLRFSNASGEYIIIGFDAAQNQFFIDRSGTKLADFKANFAPRPSYAPRQKTGTIDLTIYVDHSSIELFTDDGLTVMTEQYFTEQPLTEVILFGDDQQRTAPFATGKVTGLERIW